MTIKIESDQSSIALKEKIRSLYKHEKWYSLPKGVLGSINGNNVTIKIENGPYFWIGRGKFSGKIYQKENNSVLKGELNSPMVSITLPLPLLLFSFFDPKNASSFVLMTLIFCAIGFFIVKSDHAILKEILNEISKK